MKIVLATGVYPPELGGPATYTKALAKELQSKGVSVSVVTFGDGESSDPWNVKRVSRIGGPLLRWLRYSRALKSEASDADIVLAFSSISVGIPVALAGLTKPKKILRLGGDFFWERYTDRGGTLSLREWYTRGPFHGVQKSVMAWLLQKFDHIVFSTAYQASLYEELYTALPTHSIIENALPARQQFSQSMRRLRTSGMTGGSFRLLYFGRLVGFKNLPSLLEALENVSEARLSIVGEGPMLSKLQSLAATLGLSDRVTFLPPVHGEDKEKVFATHDLLVIPSYTELSPNSALEARAAGLPVLLSKETGLSTLLTGGMVLQPLRTPQEIAFALRYVISNFNSIAEGATADPPLRTWREVSLEWAALFDRLA